MLPFSRMLNYGNIVIPSIEPELRIIEGFYNILLLYPNGDLYVRGQNNGYQLGVDNNAANVTKWTKVLDNVARIFTSGASSLAIKNDGTFWSTGRNSYLYGGNIQSTHVFTEVTSKFVSLGIPANAIRDIKIGDNYILLNTIDNKLYVSGGNSYGQLGNGNTTNIQNLTLIVSDAVKINTTEFVSSYIDTNGVAHFCGINNNGQLGNGNTTNNSTFNSIVLDSGYKAIDTMSYGSTTSNGTSYIIAKDNNNNTKLYACGFRGNGSFGDGSSSGQSTTFVEVVNMRNIAEKINGINFHSYSSAIYGVDDRIYTSGTNTVGSLGNGNTTTKTIYSSDQVGLPNEMVYYFAFGQNLSIIHTYKDRLFYTGTGTYIGLPTVSSFTEIILPV